ncbi:histidine kinase [Cupriavidus sp. TA19]|uniref:HWE histidine kinase domain-containing protein n=1 Tax=unclassified Cupriavidus TaxID=2640874 RepID=UPI0027294A04|nr:HWE histidine kinase domain-containing protein [Cupriavidus sp. TA19]GLC92672.1 histidine kinase [Cupriavidus sp. TA19]
MTLADTVPPPDLYITAELERRPPKAIDYQGEKLALKDIAAQMLNHPGQVLPRLVERAMQLTGAASAGISAFEPEHGTPGLFRWRDLRGKLASFEGATTPRDYSPCGVCLDRFEPTLTRHPERYYGWIAEAGVVCPEVLLVPLYMAHGQPLGTLWIVAEEAGHFDAGHAGVMQEQASFVGIALAMLQNQRRLQEALERQEMLTREMDHRVNNVFAVVDGLIHASRLSAGSVDGYARSLSGRLHALAAAHALVREASGTEADGPPASAGTLHELTRAIFKPYEASGQASDRTRLVVNGADVLLGNRAIISLALVFHELATNAAKYGALSEEAGCVSVSWERCGEHLAVRWHEEGGPPIQGPSQRQGFGSILLRNTLTRQLGGTFELDWREPGLAVMFSLPLSRL